MKLKEKISIDEFDGKRYQIRIVEPNNNGKAVLTYYDLGVPVGRAFRSNLFVRSSQKGFPLQSLTQMVA